MPEPVERERYAEYIKRVQETDEFARKFEEEISPHAIEILMARYNHTAEADTRKVYFSKDRFWVEGFHEDNSYACRIELLFEKDWKGQVEETLRQEKRKYDTWAEMRKRNEAAALEKRERAQLTELLKKYPDEVKKLLQLCPKCGNEGCDGNHPLIVTLPQHSMNCQCGDVVHCEVCGRRAQGLR